MKGLDLRFPVAEIARRTEESKGNVSSYLNGKKPIPENFFKTLNDAFKDYQRPSAHINEQEKMLETEYYQSRYEDAMDTIKEYNLFLQRMLESSLSKLVEGQAGGLALVLEILGRDVRREAAGSQEKESEIWEDIANRIGPKLDADAKVDISAHKGS